MTEQESGGIFRTARPLPLLILADTSTSMDGTPIAQLNQGLQTLVQELRNDETASTSVRLSLITFDSTVKEVLKLEPISSAQIPELQASGMTSMGGAFRVAISHLSETPDPRAFLPTLVLLSDGEPNDDWETPLDELIRHPRGSKAQRLSLAIGDETDSDVLGKFVSNKELGVLKADEPDKIVRFLKYVTDSVISRSRPQGPDNPPPVPEVLR